MAAEATIRSRSPLRPSSSPSDAKWRDWSNLGEGPAGLIAECLLADDVADYIRFSAVCRPWRRLSTDPRAHSILDRRFHPRKWIMLREKVAVPDHRLFLNVSTGQCIRTRLPELRGNRVFGPTNEGLLVLLDRSSFEVRLLNPLTGQITDLPPATTLIGRSTYEIPRTFDFMKAFEVSAAGLADESTFAVYFGGINKLVVTKPGDECWQLVDDKLSLDSLPMSFEGRFYCPTNRGNLMVVETTANQPPRLVLAAELTNVFSGISSIVHLVDNGGELLLVYHHRPWAQFIFDEEEEFRDNGKKYLRGYKAYRVELKAMNTKYVLGLGGRAIFIGYRSALSVSTSVFPSIKNESIYVGLDMVYTTPERNGLYYLKDGTTEPCGFFPHGSFDDEFGNEIGPWGINGYLSWYVTHTRRVWTPTKTKRRQLRASIFE